MNAKRWPVQAERNRRAAIATGRRAFARERFSAILWANGFDGTLACIAGRAASHRGRNVDNEAATLNATHATHILDSSTTPPSREKLLPETWAKYDTAAFVHMSIAQRYRRATSTVPTRDRSAH